MRLAGGAAEKTWVITWCGDRGWGTKKCGAVALLAVTAELAVVLKLPLGTDIYPDRKKGKTWRLEARRGTVATGARAQDAECIKRCQPRIGNVVAGSPARRGGLGGRPGLPSGDRGGCIYLPVKGCEATWRDSSGPQEVAYGWRTAGVIPWCSS